MLNCLLIASPGFVEVKVFLSGCFSLTLTTRHWLVLDTETQATSSFIHPDFVRDLTFYLFTLL